MTPKHAIGGKGLNSGIRGGLWDVKHYGKMGDAVWLFGWLVLRQTTQKNGEGLVLRGKLLSYASISEDTGFPEGTLRRWMAVLRSEGYVSVKHGSYKKLVVRVLKAKKWNDRQLEFSVTTQESIRPNVADTKLSIRPEVNDSYRPNVNGIAFKSERFKEGTEIEQKHLGSGAADAAEKNLKTRPQNSRPVDHPPIELGPQQNKPQRIPESQKPKVHPQRVAYAQTADLIKAGEGMLRRCEVNGMADLKDALKELAASKGMTAYGDSCSNAADIAIRRHEPAPDEFESRRREQKGRLEEWEAARRKTSAPANAEQPIAEARGGGFEREISGILAANQLSFAGPDVGAE